MFINLIDKFSFSKKSDSTAKHILTYRVDKQKWFDCQAHTTDRVDKQKWFDCPAHTNGRVDKQKWFDCPAHTTKTKMVRLRSP